VYHKSIGNYTNQAFKMSNTKETAAEKLERLMNQPITINELSNDDFDFLYEKMAKGLIARAKGSGKKASKKSSSDEPKEQTPWGSFAAAVRAKLTEMEVYYTLGWSQGFSSYLWTDKSYSADPEKLNDEAKFKHLFERYCSTKVPLPIKEEKAPKKSKKVVVPDSEDESEAKPTTGGAKVKSKSKAKVVVDSEAEEEEVVKPKPTPKAAPKPPTKAKKEEELKTPPKEGGLVQSFKGKEVYTALVEEQTHVWLAKDGEADVDNYLGIYNPKSKEIETADEEDEE
jgi:hypothetical protein